MDESSISEAALRYAEEGSARLAPVMLAAGFGSPTFELARGSGGLAAIATWRREDGMTVETHVRGQLGIVRYCAAGVCITHQDYLRVRGRRGEYPGYSASPAGGFDHLVADLEGVAADVLTMTGEELAQVAAAVATLPRPPLP